MRSALGKRGVGATAISLGVLSFVLAFAPALESQTGRSNAPRVTQPVKSETAPLSPPLSPLPPRIAGRSVPRLLNPARTWDGRNQLFQRYGITVNYVERTRQAFWRCYPSCSDLATLEETYAAALLLKDYTAANRRMAGDALRIRFPDAPKEVIEAMIDATMTTVGAPTMELDRGIHPACNELFASWADDRSRPREPPVERLIRATENTDPAFLAYEACRNRFEFFIGPASPLNSPDPSTYVLGVIAAARYAQDLTALELRKEYELLTAALGEPEVLRSAARAMKAAPHISEKRNTREFEHLFKEQVGESPDVAARTTALFHVNVVQDPLSPVWVENWNNARLASTQYLQQHGRERVYEIVSRFDLVLTAGGFETNNTEALGCRPVWTPKTCLDSLVRK